MKGINAYCQEAEGLAALERTIISKETRGRASIPSPVRY